MNNVMSKIFASESKQQGKRFIYPLPSGLPLVLPTVISTDSNVVG
jgi:hypothetical protein